MAIEHLNRSRDARTTVDIDGVDRSLLVELQGDARLSLAELGRRVGLSPPAVADRLRRLEAAGVIVAYRTQVDPRAMGLSLTAIMRVRPVPRQLPKVAAVIAASLEVVECHRVTGEDCFVAKAHVRDVEHLEQLIDRLVPFAQTTTSIVQSSPVPPRGIELP